MSWTDLNDLSNLHAWFAPRLEAYADNDPVDTATDQETSGLRDLTGAGAARPTFNDGEVAEINEQPFFEFDGVANLLSSASFTLSQQAVVTAVVKFNSLKNYQGIVAVDDVSPPVWPVKYVQPLMYSSGQVLVAYQSPGTIYRGPSSGGYGTDWAVYSYGISSSYQWWRVNGSMPYPDSAIAGSLAAAPTGTAYIHLGYSGIGGGYINASVAEVAIYEPTTDWEIHWVEGSFADTYGLSSDLDPGHLFKEAAPESAPPTYNAAGGGGGPLSGPFG